MNLECDGSFENVKLTDIIVTATKDVNLLPSKKNFLNFGFRSKEIVQASHPKVNDPNGFSFERSIAMVSGIPDTCTVSSFLICRL